MANNRTQRPRVNGSSDKSGRLRSGSSVPTQTQQMAPQVGMVHKDPTTSGRKGFGGGKGRDESNAQSYSRYNSAYQSGGKAVRAGGGRGRWIALGVLAVLLIAIVAGATYAFVFLQNISSNLKGGYTEEQMGNIQEQLVQVQNVNDPFYVMLIGSDERANADEMGARSDSNILVRIDPVNWVVTMLSIPRDTKIEYHGSTIKFNAAYSYGDGAAGVIEATTALCNVPISHYAEVNFDGVEALVDSIGGVEVNVPQPINDPQAGTATIDSAGLQTLNGEQALVFARSRHYYLDGDFSRSANQRALIKAIVDKVFSLPVTEIPSKVQEMSKCVSTDMSVNEIYSLAMQYVNSGASMTIYSIMAPSTTQDIDGVSYVVVNTDELAQIMAVIDAGGDPNTVTTTGATSGSFEHYDYIEPDEEESYYSDYSSTYSTYGSSSGYDYSYSSTYGYDSSSGYGYSGTSYDYSTSG